MEPKWPLANLAMLNTFFFFFAFIYGQPCLSCCNRITNLFYLANHWAIRAHFIIMTEQCVTNLANSVWRWIGRGRRTHTGRRQRCDGLGPLPKGWVGGQASGQHCALFHISWALNSAHGQSSSHWILALGWEPELEIFLLCFQQQVYYRRFSYHREASISVCSELAPAPAPLWSWSDAGELVRVLGCVDTFSLVQLFWTKAKKTIN